jgi:asparagine synthase (glutamine-hydrolysing)
MCGIFALLNCNNSKIINKNIINISFELSSKRGPEKSKLITNEFNNFIFGFHRLAINGLNERSGQPMSINNITIICNGEIYNYKKLLKEINITPQTDSDCEIIIHLYLKYGIYTAVSMLDGVFAFLLYDHTNNTIHCSRDPFGVRPLYYLNYYNNEHINIIGFSSELKSLSSILRTQYPNIEETNTHISQFPPGFIYTFFKNETKWYKNNEIQYYTIPYPTSIINSYSYDELYSTHKNICKYLNYAVRKRVIDTSDRPIACLLSGGLDSSLIAALVSKYYDKQLETYSIGMKGSEDLKYAKLVADHINSKHHEIVLTEDDFFNSISEVIYNIESYDTTTVRASVGNYLISKYISENSDAKVIFNGDGSDELTGGYIYFLAVDSDIEFDKECKRLLRDIHNFDVLRSDKSISSCGLEPRTAFLDRDFVNYYLSIPLCLRNPVSDALNKILIEKNLLRESFQIEEPHLLPGTILWRTKEAFSDGVSGDNGSWFEIIKEKISNLQNKKDFENYYPPYNTPKTLEQQYYRFIYDCLFPNTADILPYFWMPKYVETDDASARTISFYKKK